LPVIEEMAGQPELGSLSTVRELQRDSSARIGLYRDTSSKSVEEIKLMGELEHMELTLLREMRRSDTLEAEFEAKMATEREEHARRIAALEKLVYQANAQNKELGIRVAELEAAQRGGTPPLLSVGPPVGTATPPPDDVSTGSRTGSSKGGSSSSAARARAATPEAPFLRRQSQYMLSPTPRHRRSRSSGDSGDPVGRNGGSTTASPDLSGTSPGCSALSDSGDSHEQAAEPQQRPEEEAFSAFMKHAALQSMSLPPTQDVLVAAPDKTTPPDSHPGSVKSASSNYMLAANIFGIPAHNGGGTGDIQTLKACATGRSEGSSSGSHLSW
jgi:hypothetical protein